MAYSRFGESVWYTFWACPLDGVVEDRETMAFEVCCVARFTAAELRADMEACITKASEHACQWDPFTPTDEEREELRGYMREFLADVDTEYPE